MGYREWARAIAVWLLVTALVVDGRAAFAQSVKPRVPAGGDPGGVAVAIIGPGIDYTWPELAVRLARDGEGEIIGWDFVDGDRRPYEPCARAEIESNGTCATLRARQIVSAARGVRLVAIRAAAHRPQTLVQAFGLLAQTRARIVLLSPSGPSQPAPLDARFLREAAQRHPALLIVAGALSSGGVADGAVWPDNVIVVAAAEGDEAVASVELRVPAGAVAQRHEIAAARVAALAARILAGEPALAPAALKQRIVALAIPRAPPVAPGGPAPARFGEIALPDGHFAGR